MSFLRLNIQLFAHHKGQGSTSNGRDSAGRRLGAKVGDGQTATAGSILYRQRGTKIFPGVNVRRGSDDTLYTTVTGVVKYERVGRDKTQVSCYPTAE
ncbi:MAG: 50S ribosomal protein L27 [Bacilli bacterium]|jgi:large subunit ribosomal protein L27|nr:50S ribosomal protein L27 [Bacillota bacterium]MBQ7105443.1 50S ribosomal protein L27 [Bacilli bacterium]